MEKETLLYQEIAESIRRLVASGELKPGDRLPPVRELARRWGCTPGTVSRAYTLLAQEGLLVGRRGSGTRVASSPLQPEPTWRWAALVNRAERFLLDALSGGHTPAQAESALALAVARWQELQARAAPRPAAAAPVAGLRFAGSHDLVVESLARMVAEHSPGVVLRVAYLGSLGGLMALAQGEAEIAGIHLWDAATDSYNVPFVQRVLPGRRVALLALAYRSLGLIIPAGNPQGIAGLEDLVRPEVCLVNRQPGSGTRVWLDAQLQDRGLSPAAVRGYERAELTHLAVARAVAQGEASVGLGIQAAAETYALSFVPLTRERYDLVIPAEVWASPAAQALVQVIRSPHFRETVLSLGGYDAGVTGQEVWLG